MLCEDRRTLKERAAGCSPLHKPKFKKDTDFVGTMVSNILRDLSFGRNKRLQSADDWYIGILKNKIKLMIS